ncbi:MAG: tetratricopeptide repeat protein [Planctomycetota bacterium]|jgi:tetratricopeptide (TPR) repeat protein
MTDKNSIENRLEELSQAIGSDESLVDNVMSGIDAGTVAQSNRVKRRFPMKRLVRLAAAAAIIIAFVLLIATFLDSSAPRAYAVGQTVEAFENVRYMHIIQRDRAGNTEDERWIEIDPDGVQARYRQDTPARSFFVVDDRQTVFVHHADKKTAVLYDPNDRTWTWFSAPGKLFQQLAAVGDDYYTVAQNVRYKGRPAHHLRWVVGDTDIYIDPETKLPFAHGEYEITYEVPPEDTFDIVIPDDVILVDKRPGAKPTQEPQWMIEEARREELDDVASDYFNDARRALVGGDHVKAVELFTKVVEIQPGRNWAWFWMGRAHYELGEYDLAIWEFSKVIDMFRRAGWDASYCHLARGLAFQTIDMDNMAHRDFGIALPVMVEALGNIKQTAMFDYADDPMFRSMSEDERPNPQQRRWSMIKRLREATGQDFGYNPAASTQEKEKAIAAWENWLQQ